MGWFLYLHHSAGVATLCAAVALGGAGFARPGPARSLDADEVKRLHRHLRATVTQLTKRGGSHTGDLQVARHRGALCPKDGAPLLRRTIGGRTTYSCPVHQL
jgi:formamidopyrimidine-DNA glycosylase